MQKLFLLEGGSNKYVSALEAETDYTKYNQGMKEEMPAAMCDPNVNKGLHWASLKLC